MKVRKLRVIFVGVLIGLLVAGCKGAETASTSLDNRIGDQSNELHDFLMAELARLGKDPMKTTSEAATGDANRVFDLDLVLIDPDGPGGDPPTGVSINWSEVLVGDYDQNGQVNVSDLTPLGRELNGTVAYDDKSLHGGFAGWPAGDPYDDGGETPPAVGSPAANWRLARIDGDRNGLLTQADITPIAVHWQEALSGYRIYRQAPGESEFTIVPGNAGTSDGLSVDHPTAPGNAPVLYGFADDNATTSGIYLYYVAPFDLQSQEQGPASGIVSIDLDTGTVNSSPVASLSVSPDFAGAPAEITLDATASYDPDGSIAAWEWDFDGDGITDWLSTDPLPEQSSDGTVDSFEEVNPGVVKVTYRQGFAEYLEPTIEVMDNAGAADSDSAQLGISGWVHEVISADDPTFDPPGNEVSFIVQDMEIDPATGEIVICGNVDRSYLDIPAGMRFARRSNSGDWQEESVLQHEGSILDELNGSAVNTEIGWQQNGEPVLLFTVSQLVFGGYSYVMFMSERSQGGTWDTQMVFEGEIPIGGVNRGAINGKIDQIEPGLFYSLVSDTTQGVDGLGFKASKYYVLKYHNGDISSEYSGWTTKDMAHPRHARSLLVEDNGAMSILLGVNYPDEPQKVHVQRRSTDGEWIYDELFHFASEFEGITGQFQLFNSSGSRKLLFVAYLDITDVYSYTYFLVNPANSNSPSALRDDTATKQEFYSGGRGESFLSYIGVDVTGQNRKAVYHDLCQANGTVVHEDVYSMPIEIQPIRASYFDALATESGEVYAVIVVKGGKEFSELVGEVNHQAEVQLFCTRVDPRPVP